MPEPAALDHRRVARPAVAQAATGGSARHQRLEARASRQPAPIQLSQMGKKEMEAALAKAKEKDEKKSDVKSAKPPKGGWQNAKKAEKGSHKPHSATDKRQELIEMLNRKRAEERAAGIEEYAKLLGHMGGEGKGKDITGGHLVAAMKANYSKLHVIGTSSKVAGWNGGWNDGTTGGKWFKASSFFPSEWSADHLATEVAGMDFEKGKTVQKLKGGLLIEKKGNTFFPHGLGAAALDPSKVVYKAE